MPISLGMGIGPGLIGGGGVGSGWGPHNLSYDSERVISTPGNAWKVSNSTQVIVPADGNHPDGLDYSVVTEAATTSSHGTLSSMLNTYTAAGTTIAASVDVKKAATSRDFIMMALGGVDDRSCRFNVDTGAVSFIGVETSEQKITDIGNGWWRCAFVSFNPTAITNVQIMTRPADGTGSYLGDITYDMLFTRCHVVLMPTNTNYVKTEGAPALPY